MPFINGFGKKWGPWGLVFGGSLEMLGYPRGDGCIRGCSTKESRGRRGGGKSQDKTRETGQKPYWAVVLRRESEQEESQSLASWVTRGTQSSSTKSNMSNYIG